jgi:hypothetical protein
MSWLVCWLLWFTQTNISELTYIRIQYLLVFVCIVHSYIVMGGLIDAFDSMIRSVMYCVAANK